MSKIKLINQLQKDFIFRTSLFTSNATLSSQQLPPDFSVLGISPDRGGSAKFEEYTISYWGDDNLRALGIRVRDEKEKLLKEDLYVFDKEKYIVTTYPKGEYQKVNPLYKDTHHTKIK